MAIEICEKTVAEVRLASVDFQPRLDSGESLASVDSVTASPSGLTLDNATRNAGIITVNGVAVPANRGVQFRVQAGAAGQSYTISVQVTTDSVPAQTLIERLLIKVKA